MKLIDQLNIASSFNAIVIEDNQIKFTINDGRIVSIRKRGGIAPSHIYRLQNHELGHLRIPTWDK